MSSTSYNPATLEFIKKDAASRKKRRLIASLVGALLVALIAFGGYWAWGVYSARVEQARKDALAAELKKATDIRTARQTLENAVQSGQVTEREARETMMRTFEERQRQVMAGYFATPAKDRDKYLDSVIDEMQKRMAEWQRDRPTTRPAWAGDRPTTRPNDERRGGNDAEREARGRARADNQSPMERAQQTEFRAALMARMRERGIEMPRGPWGRGGGGGGGGRGPGGGGGR